MKSLPVLALLATALAAGCSAERPAAHEEARPVRSAIVGASAGSAGATWSGELRARHESRLGFQTSGRIAQRLVEVGQSVRRGQLLMRLDPAQETLHVAAAAADVDAARSRVAQNRTDLERTEQLAARTFASPAEVDQQRLALAQSESQLRAALAQQQIQANRRGFTELVADRDGVVTAIQAEAGQVVASGQTVLTLAGDGEREVVVSIAEARVDEIRRARALQVSFWTQPGRHYAGTLRELAPDTDSVTRTYAARIAVRGLDAAIGLGMTATVAAPDVDGGRSIRVPLTAVLAQADRTVVWVIDPATRRVSARPVTLGAAQDDQVAIAAGLTGGETVVTAGVHMLHEGQPVKVVGEAATVAQGAVR